ncbi:MULTISPECIES: xanthine dehydrogenase family protein molybdopterin-binding subunit [unclassified Chelatococcus]|uniref:xanthine dehydrogenase family protein molybdopterin-binding subunit n=1 Tax=unclassified Chelatococcus TaxID=2638111 RepID=UPI001BCFA739|nr:MULTISPECIES: xanthine dehydrogenase family protein molybdopterin-binding subunit [unclassified Chelatococcus]CAH1651017.1 6-hydroxypseudooxynicotine dehydrogenase complex subunit gamma [Hyphomicrobiales bacterium]MBS7743228.1 xanthine dehydrogenase family protein molybdopterin-binding subunit [Chelatococcus sp. HY11]MBX3541654.1 xanthine dehydrogenase family protein molybdopterin-binding subunit [Chelatococcus sp.]MCO5074454.1 xanthine dehydrogenase family protein molybdopterin-binding subu
MSAIGRSLKRLEDRPLLTGEGRFAADNRADGQVHMRIVRSPVAFGRILDIETEEAKSLPGVIAVWTAADIADLPPIDFRMTRIAGLEPYRQHVLARDYVRYVGDPVVAVFAEDPYTAEDAAELVFCDIEEETPCLDATADPVGFMPERDPGLLSEPAVITKSYGDMEAAFAGAAAVIEMELKVGRHTGVPLEARGALAVHDLETGVLTMYGAAKVPHYNRDSIARMLGLKPEQVRLSEGHVGGGFGIRGELYPEDVLVCAAAYRLGVPVKWVEDRREHLMAANHSRDQVHRLKAAVDANGFVRGLVDTFYTDQGGYVRTHGGTVSDLAAALLPGPYLIPAYHVEGHIRLTNKTPSGTYRAPGRYETTFVRERLMDAIAARLALDPVEVRRVNLIPEDRMPFDRGIEALGTHVLYDSGKYHDLLDRTLARIGYQDLKADLARRRQAGEAVGLGIAFFVEKSGLGPHDLVTMSVQSDDTIEIVTGAASVGQGIETVMAQICSDVLGVPIERIRVIHGQTDRISIGFGAFASRVTVMTGSAVKMASEALKEKAIALAAPLLQADVGALTLEMGRVVSRDSGATISLAEIAAQSGEDLDAEGLFRADHMNYPYGIHVAQVRVDKAVCGVQVERYLVAYDVGRAINPMLIEGQIVGAAAQGIGGALLEEFVYSEEGQPLATSFADYLMPTCHEMPPVEVLLREDAPSPQNPLGVKGAGEGGITAVGAAIAAAVDDALDRPGLITSLPIAPSRLHALLRC